MAQWSFVVSWNDVWVALAAILDRPGTELVHDLWYKDDDPVCYSSLNEDVEIAIRGRPSLYLKGCDFTTSAIYMRSSGDDPGGLRLISSNQDGPLLQLSIRGEYVAKGRPVIPPSELSYSEEYLNTATCQWEKPTPELKAAYKEIQRIMRSNMVRHKGPRGFVWIGRDAFEMLKRRRATTSFFGLKV